MVYIFFFFPPHKRRHFPRVVISGKNSRAASATFVPPIHLGTARDHLDSKSEISHIHVAKRQSKDFSVDLGIMQQKSLLFLLVENAGSDSCISTNLKNAEEEVFGNLLLLHICTKKIKEWHRFPPPH